MFNTLDDIKHREKREIFRAVFMTIIVTAGVDL